MTEEHRLGPYHLLKRLGTGGMAETWLAVHQSMVGVRKFVALKCILPSCNDAPDYIRLFYREASIALRLDHPSLISAWSCGPIEGRHVMSMEYLRGVTLEELMLAVKNAGETIRYDIASWIAIQILDGLEYLHTLRDESGVPLRIVHRDVSPQNIFVCYDGRCRLIDFGVARRADDADDPQHGMIVGSPAYMSPEQCRSDPVDGKSDDYAIAVILYEMTTGVQLFQRENEIQTYNALMNDDVRPPSSVVRGFPLLLSRVIMRGLSRNPSKRHESSGRFANELRMYMNTGIKKNAQAELKRMLAAHFSEDIRKTSALLAHACEKLDKTSPGIHEIIAESRQICDIPSGAAESIDYSRLEQLNGLKAQTCAAASPPAAQSRPDLPVNMPPVPAPRDKNKFSTAPPAVISTRHFDMR